MMLVLLYYTLRSMQYKIPRYIKSHEKYFIISNLFELRRKTIYF